MKLVHPLVALVSLFGSAAVAADALNGAQRSTHKQTVDYRMVAHPKSGVELPRIRLAARPALEQAVNDQLDSLAGEMMCLADTRSEDPWYETNVEVAHADNDLLSVEIHASYFCGGAHPVNGANLSVTFDLLTGRPVRLRELFEDYPRDSARIAEAYAESLTAEQLEGCEDVLSVGLDSGDEERIAEEEVGMLEQYGFNYTLSSQGLTLQPIFPNVVAACAHSSTLPFDRIRAFASKEGILMRVADGSRITSTSGPDAWKPLDEFENVEAFELQLLGEQNDCLARTGGGTLAGTCFKLHELWDRELNIQYKRLRDALDSEGREKLTRSQKDWITYRDSTFAFNLQMLDFNYSAPGTLWVSIRAGAGVDAMARVIRNRTLMLIEWRRQHARGPVTEESLLNEVE